MAHPCMFCPIILTQSLLIMLAHPGARFVAYVPLPDQKAIEQLVLEKKKADLLAKYTSDSLAKEQEEAKSLLNVRH